MKKLFLTALVFAGITATAQVKVGNNPTTLATNAQFQVEGTTAATDQFVVLKNGNVGIGTTAPAAKFEVVGGGVGNFVVDGPGVYTAQARLISGNYGFMLRNDGEASYLLLTNSGDQYGAWNDLRPFRVDNATGTTTIGYGSGQYCGIGTLAPYCKLEVNGQVASTEGYTSKAGRFGGYTGNVFNINWSASGAELWIDVTNFGAIVTTSDRRLKENIKSLNNTAIGLVEQLRPVSFNRKTIEGTIFKGNNKNEVGFIADELMDVIPSAVNGVKDGLTSEGKIQPLTVNLAPIVSVLTKAIQEQQAQIEALKAEVAKLKK